MSAAGAGLEGAGAGDDIGDDLLVEEVVVCDKQERGRELVK